MLEQRHKMALLQLEKEMQAEMQKQRELLNRELEDELQAELMVGITCRVMYCTFNKTYLLFVNQMHLICIKNVHRSILGITYKQCMSQWLVPRCEMSLNLTYETQKLFCYLKTMQMEYIWNDWLCSHRTMWFNVEYSGHFRSLNYHIILSVGGWLQLG